ncbi:MAG: hypothetical protein ACLUVV_03085 [Christensenellales bacterium]
MLRCPGILRGCELRLLPNVNGGPYDLALIAEFDSMEAVRRYQQHPCIWTSSRRRKAG